MTADPLARLRTEGWVPQFTASGPRLSEAVDNYRDLGFEVLTVPYRELAAGGCTVCFEDADATMMILTRKPVAEPPASGETNEE